MRDMICWKSLLSFKPQNTICMRRHVFFFRLWQARLDIEVKKKELQEARIVRQHMAEYEVCEACAWAPEGAQQSSTCWAAILFFLHVEVHREVCEGGFNC